MPKVKLTGDDLRKIIAEAIIHEVRDPSAGEITSSTLISDLVKAQSAFDATDFLALIGALTGRDTNAWWQDIQSGCSVNNVIKSKCAVNGTETSYGQYDASRVASYATNPGDFLYGFLNFIAMKLLEGCEFKMGSVARPTYDSGFNLKNANLFDVIMVGDVAYVQTTDLQAQCTEYLDAASVKLMNEIDLAAGTILADLTAFVKDPKNTPGAESKDKTCWTYVSAAKQAEIEKKASASVQGIVSVLDNTLLKTQDEVYESYLYIPLLAPRVWKNPDLQPDSPLYTPWRMTWSACNLLGDIIQQHGSAGKYAILSNLYRVMQRGTLINTYDAPGKDFAMGEVESINEARYNVDSVILTEAQLRRVIQAALRANLQEANPVLKAASAGARAVGGVAMTGAAAAGAALRAAGEEVIAAGRGIDDFVNSVKTGRIAAATFAAASGVSDALKARLGGVSEAWQRRIRAVYSTASADIDNFAKIDPAEIISQFSVTQADADLIAFMQQKLMQISATKVAGGDITALTQEVTLAAQNLSDDARGKILAKTPEELSNVFASQTDINAGIDLMQGSGGPAADLKAGMYDDLKKSIEKIVSDTAPDSQVRVSMTANGAVNLMIPRPLVAADGTVTLDSSTLIPLSRKTAAIQTEARKITGTGAAAKKVAAETAYDDLLNLPGDAGLDDVVAAANSLTTSVRQGDYLGSTMRAQYTAVATSLKTTIGARTAAGTTGIALDAGAPGRTARAIAATVKLADKLSPLNPASGTWVPGIADTQNQAIGKWMLTREAWQSVKSSFQDARTGAERAVTSGTPADVSTRLAARGVDPDVASPGSVAAAAGVMLGNQSLAVVKFCTYFLGAAAWDSATGLTRAKVALGQTALSKAASVANKSTIPLIAGAGAKAQSAVVHPVYGRYLGAAAASVVTTLGSALLTGVSGMTSEKLQKDSPALNVLKTFYADMTRPPITINRNGITFAAGGPLRTFAGLVAAIYTNNVDRTRAGDFAKMIESVRNPGETPDRTVDRVLSDALANLYKNCIVPDDISDITTLFPELRTNPLQEIINAQPVVQAGSAFAQATSDALKSLYEGVIGEISSPTNDSREDWFKKARARSAEIKASMQSTIQTVEAYKAAVKSERAQSGAEASDVGDMLDRLNAQRLIVVNTAMKFVGTKLEEGVSAPGLRSQIEQYRAELVLPAYNREEGDEQRTSDFDFLLRFLDDSSEYIDFFTSYKEFAAGGPAGSIVGAARGSYGLEFQGSLEDKDAQAMLKELAGMWETSSKGIATVIAGLTAPGATQ